MKYLKQALIILAFTLAGELLAKAIPLPIPAAIYGFILLFTALCTGLLKPSAIDKTADFMISLMPLLFVAPAVGILEYFDILAPPRSFLLLPSWQHPPLSPSPWPVW